MKVQSKKSRISDIKDSLLVVFVFEKQKIPNELLKFTKGLQKKQFEGKLLQTYSTSTLGNAGFQRLLVIGLGEKKDFQPDFLRRAAGLVVRYSVGARLGSASVVLPDLSKLKQEEIAQALTEGAILVSHKFIRFKSDTKDMFFMKNLSLISNANLSAGIRKGTILATAQNHVRDIEEQPANIITPEKVAQEAKSLAKTNKLSITVYDEKQLKKMKMNAILAVGQGSVNPPRLVMLEYNKGKNLPLYVVVGKGVTFDSGGISIKPSKNMHEMKYDKCGAIAVLGILKAVSELNLPIRLVGLMPCVENLPSATAQRPRDIITAYNGKTIEVLHTDAEGRLILADALAYGAKMKPKAMIDLATLTGAIMVALGTHALGLFTNDDSLKKKIEQAGNASYERVWQLPVWKEYSEMMKSDIADVKNISNTPFAGSITAAAFLKEFIGDTKWAHLDIAGMDHVAASHPYLDKGATGVGVRLVTEALSLMAKK